MRIATSSGHWATSRSNPVEHLQILFASLPQHESFQRHTGTVERLHFRDFVAQVGLQTCIFHLLEYGLHREERNEQGESNHDLIGGRLATAQGLSDERKDDHRRANDVVVSTMAGNTASTPKTKRILSCGASG